MSRQGFDEVMIVNPYDPRSNIQPTKYMRFHEAPEMGHYPPRQAAQMGYYAAPGYGYGNGYGYYGEPADYGWYAEPPDLGWYAEAPDLGWYAEAPELGYYGEAPDGYGYGWYGEPELGYGEPIEYAEDLNGYGEPEMVGYGDYGDYGEYEEYEPLSEADYGEPDLAGYVRENPARYNPGCLVSSNVAGYGEAAPLEGYVRPSTVNPTCENLTPQPGIPGGVPEGFRPLW